MRRHRKQRESVSLSLFPFLAVLICTMGVLIVLLVLVTREANVQASLKKEQQSDEEQAEEDELARIIDTESFRATMLEELRPELAQRLQDARLKHGHLQQQLLTMRERAEQLERQWQSLDQQFGDEQSYQQDRQLADLQRQIDSASQDLSARRQQTEEMAHSYAVVPYPGPNGTTRRPIYIECTAEGIYLQPHGILLTDQELSDPILPGNPLEAALLAVREYWQNYGGIQANEEPYPLIVIRPDGAHAYAAARQAMKAWDDEFGYELVSDDVNLSFPGEDSLLATHLEDVVRQASYQHAQLQLAVAMQQRSIRSATSEYEGAGGSGQPYEQLTGQSRGEGSISGGSGFSSSSTGSPDGQGSSTGSVTYRASPTRGGFIPQSNSSASTNAGRSGFTSEQDQSSNPSSRTGESYANQTGNGVNSQMASAQSQQLRMPQGASSGMSSANAEGQGNLSIGQSAPTTSQSAASNVQQLSNGRGADWALPSKSPTATAFRKPIQITCAGDRLIIFPGAYSTEPIREVLLTGSTERHVDEMVDGIWRLIDSWGFAGYNAYFKPELHLNVLPDGEQRFQELQVLMRGSGLDLKRKVE